MQWSRTVHLTFRDRARIATGWVCCTVQRQLLQAGRSALAPAVALVASQWTPKPACTLLEEATPDARPPSTATALLRERHEQLDDHAEAATFGAKGGELALGSSMKWLGAMHDGTAVEDDDLSDSIAHAPARLPMRWHIHAARRPVLETTTKAARKGAQRCDQRERGAARQAYLPVEMWRGIAHARRARHAKVCTVQLETRLPALRDRGWVQALDDTVSDRVKQGEGLLVLRIDVAHVGRDMSIGARPAAATQKERAILVHLCSTA